MQPSGVVLQRLCPSLTPPPKRPTTSTNCTISRGPSTKAYELGRDVLHPKQSPEDSPKETLRGLSALQSTTIPLSHGKKEKRGVSHLELAVVEAVASRTFCITDTLHLTLLAPHS